MSKLAIIHTTPVTVNMMKALAAETGLPCEIVNFVDDSVLPQLATNGGNVAEVAGRLIQYAEFAEQVGADLILSACSSVGEVVAEARQRVSIPIVRIDDEMAEEAVRCGTTIGVAATLRTTLNPTMALLRSKAGQLGKEVELVPMLAEDAYRQLIQGDQEAHDTLLLAALGDLVQTVDIVVLAQASMSRVIEKMAPAEQARFLSSPKLALLKVKELLQGSR